MALSLVLLALAAAPALSQAPEPPAQEPSAQEPIVLDLETHPLESGAPPAEDGAHDPWQRVRRLPAGPERTAAIVASLAEAALEPLSAQARYERLDVAYRAFLDADERFAAGEMLELARAMHARASAVWSAFCLEGALRRGHGSYEEADAVLASQLAAAEAAGAPLPARVELLERRAIVAAGAGWWDQERALLGRALVRGGTDARQILGLRALSAGRLQESAALFGALLSEPPDESQSPVAPQDRAAWALRGWGLSLLPSGSDPLEGSEP